MGTNPLILAKLLNKIVISYICINKSSMKILITNDDGYKARGLEALIEAMRPFGDITVVAPKYHQSGMSMAISLGFKRIAVKQISKDRWYLDGTPASCVKFGIDNILTGDRRPDVVVCGINHGSNAATAALYSGTLGAAQEAAVNGILGIGVSLDDFSPEGDFSAIQALLPDIFRKLSGAGRRLLWTANMKRFSFRFFGKADFYDAVRRVIPRNQIQRCFRPHRKGAHFAQKHEFQDIINRVEIPNPSGF